MLVKSRDRYDEDEDEFVEGEWHGQFICRQSEVPTNAEYLEKIVIDIDSNE